MTAADPETPLVRTLSVHADYRCAHAGACCRAGWTIPVDPPVHAALAARLAQGHLSAPPGRHPPFVPFAPDDPTRLALGHDDEGACVFLAGDGSSRCRIHRDVGEALLPIACQQFPRVAVVGDSWVDVTLSHACPTAARRLVDWTQPLALVPDPACCRGRVFEGLDTRGHLPPLLRPGALHSLDSWRRFEAGAVACLDGHRPIHARLATLDAWVQQLETWSPRRGPLEAFVAHVVSSHDMAGARDGSDAARARTHDDVPVAPAGQVLDDWCRARQAVPAARSTMPRVEPVRPADIEAARQRLGAWDAVVGRYLATKVFASWVPWLATRVSTLSRVTRIAYHALVVEAARRDAPLTRDDLVSVIRQADLLLVHLVEMPALVRSLETGMPPRP